MNRFRLFSHSLCLAVGLGSFTTALLDGGPAIDATQDELRIAVPAPYRLSVQGTRLIVDWGPGLPGPLPPAPSPGPEPPAPPKPDPEPTPPGPPATAMTTAGYRARREIVDPLRALADAVRRRVVTSNKAVIYAQGEATKKMATLLGDAMNAGLKDSIDLRDRDTIIDPAGYARALEDVAAGWDSPGPPAVRKGR